MAKKSKAMDAIADINVTPMVDVMLVLLIIFMVITPMLTKGMSVDMVTTDNPIAMQDADKDDAILIAITRDGRVYLGTKEATVEDIGAKVADQLSGRIDKTSYLRVDQRARYEVVMSVIDSLRGSGVDQVGLLTEQSKSAKASSPDTIGDGGGI